MRMETTSLAQKIPYHINPCALLQQVRPDVSTTKPWEVRLMGVRTQCVEQGKNTSYTSLVAKIGCLLF